MWEYWSPSWSSVSLDFQPSVLRYERRAPQVVRRAIFDSARCDPGPFIIRKGSVSMGRISEDSESVVDISSP